MPASANPARWDWDAPPLPVVRVGEIPDDDPGARWLVEGLWGASSGGVIGGAPTCAKTWLGLDLAHSVATGTACLGPYAVPAPGPARISLAEDALPVVRQRVAGMARHRGIDLAGIAMHVITAPGLRLDRDPDRTRLLEATRRLRPRLLLLDPLVRLHRIDENHAGEVAELLAYFRSLQRQLDLAVVLVHHTRKNAAGGVAAGVGLRGSGDIHAFGDSNLYLRRSRDQLVLSSEHRAAPASPPVHLELVATDAATTHLEVVGEQGDGSTPLTIVGPRRSLEERVLELLGPGATVTRAKLRDSLGVKNERLGAVLEALERAGRLRHTSTGWRRREGSIEQAVPVPPQEMIGNGTVEPAPSRSAPRTRLNHARD
jgi:AAA domain